MDVIDICVPTPLRKTQGSRPVVRRAGRRGGGRDAPARAARHPRVDDLSGDDRRGRAADARGEGAEGRTSISSSRSRPSASIPGNAQFTTRNIPKVVGGVGAGEHRGGRARCTRAVVDTVVPVSSTRVAEMVKLLENTFRAVNIGLVNEIALMCHKMDIDVWEVIDAAKTKPFGFMPFYPGPGPRRPLHSDRSVLPVVEGAAERLRVPLHRAGRPGQRLDAGVRRRARRRRAEHASGSRSTDRASTCSASPTSGTSATCASRRRSTSSSCCIAAARSSATRIRTCRRCSTATST